MKTLAANLWLLSHTHIYTHTYRLTHTLTHTCTYSPPHTLIHMHTHAPHGLSLEIMIEKKHFVVSL